MDLSSWPVARVFLVFLCGLILLFGGGHFLVKGSSRLAGILGIHPMIIGLTVVALGTSMPEFVVSLLAAIRGNTDVALGNIVGSNVTNIGLILGLSAFLSPLAINLKLLRFEVPLVVGISIYFWLICANSTLSRIDGFTLLVGFFAYLAIVITGAKKNPVVRGEKYGTLKQERKRVGAHLASIVAGIVGLSIGAEWIVSSASEISRRLGATELILGLTLVSLGTSLPELATSVVAACKKEGDISIGNVIGSNIFNIMAIAGPSALAHPLPVTKDLVYYHLPAMTVLTIIMVPLLMTGRKLGRIEGSFLMACYVGIMLWWIKLAV